MQYGFIFQENVAVPHENHKIYIPIVVLCQKA